MLLRTRLLKDLDDEAIERAVNVNPYGTIHVVKAFPSHLLECPTAYLASVSSTGGFLPVAGQPSMGHQGGESS